MVKEMNIYELIVLIIALSSLVISGISIVNSYDIKKIKKEFFAGKNGVSLEDFIIRQNQKINELTAQTDLLEANIRGLQELQKTSIQKIGLLRYNPFKDDGGNLSFSIALLDGKDNGLVLTSMHGREQNRVYAKPISKGESDFALTEEEKQAIETSRNF
jgi:hypothetical protein